MAQFVQSVATVPLFVVLGASLVAALTDVRSFRIPNYVTLPLFALGILFHALAPSGHGLGFALLGAAVGFGCLILFYVLGAVGAGDVKLLAAVGAWIGPVVAFGLFLCAALLMGLYAIVLSWWQGTLHANLYKTTYALKQGLTIARHLGADERVEEVVRHDNRRSRLIPFAVMVLGGVAVIAAIKYLDL